MTPRCDVEWCRRERERECAGSRKGTCTVQGSSNAGYICKARLPSMEHSAQLFEWRPSKNGSRPQGRLIRCLHQVVRSTDGSWYHDSRQSRQGLLRERLDVQIQNHLTTSVKHTNTRSSTANADTYSSTTTDTRTYSIKTAPCLRNWATRYCRLPQITSHEPGEKV